MITGFSISGKVLSYNEPVPNVSVFLHQGDRKIVDKSKGALSSIVTDSQGAYKFTKIPAGQYQIVAQYSESQSKF